MTAIMRQIEEMEQQEEAVEAGPCFTQLEPLKALLRPS